MNDTQQYSPKSKGPRLTKDISEKPEFISIQVRKKPIYHRQPDLLASRGKQFNVQAMIKLIFIKLEQIHKNQKPQEDRFTVVVNLPLPPFPNPQN